MKYVDLYPEDLTRPQNMYCKKCKKWLRLIFDNFENDVDGIHLKVHGLPYLYCKDCNERYLPDRSRGSLILATERAQKNNKKNETINRIKNNEIFGFCESAKFFYDPDDYYYIPGLFRDISPGFLTPVFFNKHVLLKYQNWPGYHLKLAARTYGDVSKSNNEGCYDYVIPFGINQNGKVIMWLGDIDKLSFEEQCYLRSENVPSDHDIGCEFYDGQIECRFSDAAIEDRLMKVRSEMLDEVEKCFGRKTAFLDDETLDLIYNLQSPIVFSIKEIKDVIDNLNKIVIESLSSKALKEIIDQSGYIEKDRLGTLKMLQKILEIRNGGIDIAGIMSPFFVLYDWRVLSLHLMTEETQTLNMKKIYQRLKLEDSGNSINVEELYSLLLIKLCESCERISEICRSDMNKCSSL